MSRQRVIIPLRPGSDGDATHKPKSTAVTLSDPPTIYLEKIGQQWMQARGEAKPGVHYVLERLPDGYTLWQKPRSSGTHVDKWLYGHPDHKYFDSPNRFFPHFQYLMENDGSNIGCPCTVCNGKAAGFLPSGSNSSASTPKLKTSSVPSRSKGRSETTVLPKSKGRPKMTSVGMDSNRVDEEGTPDVYRNLIDKLKRHGALDESISEPMSMDWRAEQVLTPTIADQLKTDPQWTPRPGDIILWVRDLPTGVDIRRDKTKSGELRLYDKTTSTFADFPAWEAALVGQTPKEAIDIDDIVDEGDKQMSVSYSGVRVEPLPHPNDSNKSLSKRYRYVPVHQTRPFNLWHELLGPIPEEDWHPTIKNALALMSTMTVIDKHHFKGAWPSGQIYCRGIYVGSELLVQGDTARLLPKTGQTQCTDILVIGSIRVKLSNLDLASTNDYDEGRPYNTEIWAFGAGYTLEAERSDKQWVTDENFSAPRAAKGYGQCYPLHPSDKELAVPFSRLMGRLYEQDALALWLNCQSRNMLSIDNGRVALLKARAFAREHDQRISDLFDATWFWGDTRSEALDLQTVNGLDVGIHDQERDPKDWRKKIKIMDGIDNDKAGLDSKLQAVTGKDLRAFMAPGMNKTTLPTRQHRTLARDDTNKRRSSSEEEESSGDELGQHTWVKPTPVSKRQKVIVKI